MVINPAINGEASSQVNGARSNLLTNMEGSGVHIPIDIDPNSLLGVLSSWVSMAVRLLINMTSSSRAILGIRS
jgi:hypothetical protein